MSYYVALHAIASMRPENLIVTHLTNSIGHVEQREISHSNIYHSLPVEGGTSSSSRSCRRCVFAFWTLHSECCEHIRGGDSPTDEWRYTNRHLITLLVHFLFSRSRCIYKVFFLLATCKSAFWTAERIVYTVIFASSLSLFSRSNHCAVVVAAVAICEKCDRWKNNNPTRSSRESGSSSLV